MNRYTEEEAKIRYLEFFKANPPAVILAKGLEDTPESGGCGKADRYSAADHHREYLHLYLVARSSS